MGDIISEHKIIAIVRGLETRYIPDFAGALAAGGIKLIEVTFDQRDPASWAATAQSIALINGMDGVFAGAGTVMSEAQIKIAGDAGAKYIISPNADERVIRKTREAGLISIPGCLTPTEAANAWAWGASYVKIFPAGELGEGYVKAIRAPLGHIPMLAVGGVNPKNARAFMKAGCSGIGVGGNIVNKELIHAGEFDKITEMAREYVEQVSLN